MFWGGFIVIASSLLPTHFPSHVDFLTREQVVVYTRAQAPAVQVAQARTLEAEAGRVGARAVSSNPDLTVQVGPRFPQDRGSGNLADVFVSLDWPLELTRAPTHRLAVAEARVQVAAEHQNEALAQQIYVALGLWYRGVAAARQARQEEERGVLDQELTQVAQVRRDAGTVSDVDVALARMVQAQGRARLATAKGEASALRYMLGAELGVADGHLGRLTDTLPEQAAAPASLTHLSALVEKRPDRQRMLAALRASRADLCLQNRLRAPQPRVGLGAGRSAGYTFQVSLSLPLPVYQRNQTARAQSRASVQRSVAEDLALAAQSQGELEAAYARYRAASLALEALAGATSSVGEVERLAARAYELGQQSLAEAVATRREAAFAAAALVHAELAAHLARLSLDLAAGDLL